MRSTGARPDDPPTMVGIPAYTLVDDLLVTAPLVVAPGASVQSVAEQMRSAGIGCAAVLLGDGDFGLVTDATIRDVVAAGRPVSTPVAEVMRGDPPTVRAETSATEGLIRLLESGSDYVLVLDRAGGLRGAVAPRDFVVSPSTAGAALLEQIRRAGTVEELRERYEQLPGMLDDLTVRGLAPSRVILVHSAIVDAMVCRSLAMASERRGVPLDDVTWLSLGSNGRREAVPGSDIDAAVAFDDTVSDARIGQLRQVFADATGILGRAGLRQDLHGVSPVDPAFSRRRSEWRAAARGWMADLTQHDAAIMTCLLVDARPILGALGAADVRAIFERLNRHPSTMADLLLVSVGGSPARRWWPRLRVPRHVDIKADVTLPIVNLGRWAALSVGSPDLPTGERLRAAAGSPMLPVEDASTLVDAFELVQGLRLRQHLDQLAAGTTPTDIVHTARLSRVERGSLTRVLREVASIRRRMGTMSSYVLPELDPSTARPR